MNVAIKASVRGGAMYRFREEMGITQTRAAEMAGVSLTTWNALECLNFSRSTEPVVAKIAALIGVSTYEIRPAELVGKDARKKAVRYAEIPPERLLSIGREALMLPDKTRVDPVDQASLHQAIDVALETLTYREREIIKLRYGIPDGQQHTYGEVGKIFQVTRERVRQVEARAIKKLCAPVVRTKIAGALGFDDNDLASG